MNQRVVAAAVIVIALASAKVLASAASESAAAMRGHLLEMKTVVLAVSTSCSSSTSSGVCAGALGRVSRRAKQAVEDIEKRVVPACLSGVKSTFLTAMRNYEEGARESAEGFNAEDTEQIIAGFGKLLDGDAAVKEISARLAETECR